MINVYSEYLSFQYIDVTLMQPRRSIGNHFLRIIINPNMKVPEQNYDNNMLICRLDYDLDTLFVRYEFCHWKNTYK